MPTAEASVTLADLIRAFFRNTKILSDHPRLGPVAASSLAGYQHNSDLGKNSTISEFNRPTALVGARFDKPHGTRRQKRSTGYNWACGRRQRVDAGADDFHGIQAASAARVGKRVCQFDHFSGRAISSR
jgi:hypothetical protein